MRKIDITVIFDRLCAFDCEVLNYINRKQGDSSAPLNICELAERLVYDKSDVRKAVNRLVAAKILLADGENFKIAGDVFKKPADGGKQ